MMLDHDHRISIAEEAVFILDSFFVCLHCEFIASKSAGHDQETGFGQVQVSHQCIGHVERIRRVNKDVGPAFGGLQ